MPSGCPGCEKLSESRFVIADASMSAKIDFHQSAKKMIQRIKDGFKQLTAFRKSLKEFENMNHGNIQERLAFLIDAKVDIKINESNNADDDPIVLKLTKLEAESGELSDN